MTIITFIHPNGQREQVSGTPGTSLMQTARDHEVVGILGECGGHLSCATCHVYVAHQFIRLLPVPDKFEDDMLDGTASEREINSRLSCQIILTSDLPELEVEIPQLQI